MNTFKNNNQRKQMEIEEELNLSFEKPKDKFVSESFTTIASRTKERRSRSGKKQIPNF